MSFDSKAFSELYNLWQKVRPKGLKCTTLHEEYEVEKGEYVVLSKRAFLDLLGESIALGTLSAKYFGDKAELPNSLIPYQTIVESLIESENKKDTPKDR